MAYIDGESHRSIQINMTTIKIKSGIHAVFNAYSAIWAFVSFLISPLTSWAENARDKKLILAVANPVIAFTSFADYKEAAIETRLIEDSRGRSLAQVKLWIYQSERKCYREVTFLNQLLLASVGINRLPFQPLVVGKSDTPAALLEVTVRELETWLRNRTPGTQFGIDSARHAAAKPAPLRVVSVLPEERPTPVAQKPATPAVPAVTSPLAAAPVPAPVASMKHDVPDQTVAPSDVPPQESAQFQRATPRPDIKAKTEEFTVGVLQSLGMQPRTVGNREFKQYCVDVLLTEGESRGMVKRLWGTDLERALTDSGARLGQTVHVWHHGSMPIANSNGGSSYKNSFSMKVLK
jgi:hypothetical protein